MPSRVPRSRRVRTLVHNTQPWRWRIVANGLELFAERSRQLNATDAPGQLLLVSCGAALDHARVALAAEGWTAEVERLPDGTQPDLLARLKADRQDAGYSRGGSPGADDAVPAHRPPTRQR